MELITGLGNPGLKYFNSRHNIGYIVADKLAEFFKINSFIRDEYCLAAKTEYKESTVILIKPLTYMNLSGIAVKDYSGKFGIPNDKILIIYDDADLDFGVIRLRPAGSDGGHNGMKSVIYELQSEEIPRLRVGIYNQPEIDKIKANGGSLKEFVLSDFTDDEIKQLNKVTDAARDAVLFYLEFGIKDTMNVHNRNVIEPGT